MVSKYVLSKSSPYLVLANQGWAIPGFGQQYYTQYYTGQKYAKLYNTLYKYYTKSNQLILMILMIPQSK